MGTPELNRQDIMDEFHVLYDKNHGGTFNGCLETLHISLEEFLKDKVRELIPTIQLDYRTSLGKCFRFLKGDNEKFFVKVAGQERYDWFQHPSIFTRDGERFIYDLLDERNRHVHVESSYPVLANFADIKIPMGTHYCLIFNPTATIERMVFDETNTLDSTQFKITIRSVAANTTNAFDMSVCDQYWADLILECLTKKEFEAENPDEPDFGTHTHALVIYYGKQKFFVYFRRTTYVKLRSCFNYEAASKWKTHYFRFTAPSILSRLIA